MIEESSSIGMSMIHSWAEQQPDKVFATFLTGSRQGMQAEERTYGALQDRTQAIAARIMDSHSAGQRALLTMPKIALLVTCNCRRESTGGYSGRRSYHRGHA